MFLINGPQPPQPRLPKHDNGATKEKKTLLNNAATTFVRSKNRTWNPCP